MKEQDIQKVITEWLEWNGYLVIKINNTGIYKQATGQYIPPRQKGISDLVACKNGQFIAIEVKTEKGKLTEYQQLFLDQVKACGGIAIVARSVDDLEKQL